MSIAAVGWNSLLGLAEETTYGTPVTPSTHWLPIVRHSLKVEQNIKVAEYLSSGNSNFHNARVDRLLSHAVSGDIETIAAYDSTAFLLMLQYALGEHATTGVSAPYTHTFTPQIAADDIEGLTIQAIDGSHDSLDTPMIFAGCLVNTMELEFMAEEYAMARFGVLGKRGYDYDTLSGSPTFTPPEEVLAQHVGQMQWAQNHTLTRLGIRLNRSLGLRRKLGSIYTDRPQPTGRGEIVLFGTMEVDEDNQTFYSDWLAGTTNDATIVITGTGDNRITITADNAKITRLDRPIATAGVLTYDFEMRCKSNATDEGLTIAVRNSASSAY